MYFPFLSTLKFMRKNLAALLLIAAIAVGVYPQSSTKDKNELSVWSGFSPASTASIIGRTRSARYGTIAFRYARRFNTGNQVNLRYTADIVPLAIVNFPDVEIRPPSFRAVRETRYGFGMAPAGIQVNFRPRKKLQPFIAASGGMLYFNQRLPNYTGTRFNFTADIGGGIQYELNGGRSITFGYKYHHISNGNRGIDNPGIDNNLFYVGYTFFSN